MMSALLFLLFLVDLHQREKITSWRLRESGFPAFPMNWNEVVPLHMFKKKTRVAPARENIPSLVLLTAQCCSAKAASRGMKRAKHTHGEGAVIQ